MIVEDEHIALGIRTVTAIQNTNSRWGAGTEDARPPPLDMEEGPSSPPLDAEGDRRSPDSEEELTMVDDGEGAPPREPAKPAATYRSTIKHGGEIADG